MSMKDILTGWTIDAPEVRAQIREYSTTGDILSYKRCRRQYGQFGVRGFASASSTQRYFGNLVHDTLDRINRNYRLNPTLPELADVTQLVQEAHDRLTSSGVRAYNAPQQQEYAAKLIYRFVKLIGPHFFPKVTHTEYRLKQPLKTNTGHDYVLTGVVDVLTAAVSHELGLNFDTEPDDVEIWDYKSEKLPPNNSKFLDNYRYQMRVYSQLYQAQTGAFPARAVLVFLGELGDDEFWRIAAGDPRRYPNLIYVVTPTAQHIKTAMNDFHQTVEDIEAERTRPYDQQWAPPLPPPPTETCDACDLRFNCASFPEGSKLRNSPL